MYYWIIGWAIKLLLDLQCLPEVYILKIYIYWGQFLKNMGIGFDLSKSLKIYVQVGAGESETFLKCWASAWKLFFPSFIVLATTNLLLSGFHIAYWWAEVALGPIITAFDALHQIVADLLMSLDFTTTNQNPNLRVFSGSIHNLRRRKIVVPNLQQGK